MPDQTHNAATRRNLSSQNCMRPDLGEVGRYFRIRWNGNRIPLRAN